MNRGYVRLWRKSLDAGWIRNHKLWVFWSYCLLKASYKEYDAIVGLQIVHLSPGQFVFGLKKASQETGLTIREIRTILDFLKKAGNLTIKTTNKFSIISIVNWHTYQPQEDENDTQNDKQVANKGQHTRSIEVKNKTYVTFFENFWSTYPSRNGKKLGKGETLKKFSQLKETDLPLVLQAVKNYATSEDVKNGIGIRDPKRFLKDNYWREWIEPTQGEPGTSSYIESVKQRMGLS
ncbi:MAG: hypothetical protein A4E63_01024 [Syntrophorhabdus sp. PtaU1.Bin050]|nr:MAG: hypothetical protein A4E63_01024 [Syntrophorhabdus sp. PtaU1.Bin050]